MKKLGFIVSLGISLIFVVSYSFGAVVFLDTFSDSFPNPEIGTYQQTGGTNELFNEGSNNWLRSVDISSTDVNAGFRVTASPTVRPIKGTVEYDFQIVPVGDGYIDSYIAQNAFGQELILSPGGNNLFLYWGENNEMRLWKSYPGQVFTDLGLINITWAPNTVYHITWTIDADANTFGLSIDDEVIFENEPFGQEIDNLQTFSFASNMQSIVAQLMDNITISGDTFVPTPVHIDIKPGSEDNKINLKSKGKITVAILSTTHFDAPNQGDQNSLTFGATGDEDSLTFCNNPGDVNGDGLEDLVCHFNTESTGFLCGDTEGILKGETKDGIPIWGSDSVIIAPCRWTILF